MKFINYEIRQVADFGEWIGPVSDCNTDKAPIEQFWSLYGRTPADEKGRCLIGQVWNATTYADIRNLYQRLTGCDLTETPQDHFDLPVNPPAKRTHADDLTIAFITVGAQEELCRQQKLGDVRLDNGHLGYIDDVIRHAPLLDRVADYFDEHGTHPGVFAYKVAEEFGRQFGEKVLLDEGTAQQAKKTLYAIMIDCAYDEDMLVEAFEEI